MTMTRLNGIWERTKQMVYFGNYLYEFKQYQGGYWLSG